MKHLLFLQKFYQRNLQLSLKKSYDGKNILSSQKVQKMPIKASYHILPPSQAEAKKLFYLSKNIFFSLPRAMPDPFLWIKAVFGCKGEKFPP